MLVNVKIDQKKYFKARIFLKKNSQRQISLTVIGIKKLEGDQNSAVTRPMIIVLDSKKFAPFLTFSR